MYEISTCSFFKLVINFSKKIAVKYNKIKWKITMKKVHVLFHTSN